MRIFIFLLFLLFLSKISSATIASSESQEGAKQWADSVLSTLSLEQKIGQLIMVTSTPSQGLKNEEWLSGLIARQMIGGVLFLRTHPTVLFNHAKKYQAKSKLPLFVALDAENGLSFRLDSVIKYPYNLGLGAIQNDSLLYQMGREVGQQCKILGVNLNFAPVVDVNSNPNNPIINYRSFGEIPENVAVKSWLYAKGMQDEGILVSAKHFPGHGDTSYDSHLTMPAVSKDYAALDSVDFVPFKYCINRGIRGIMTAHINLSSIDKSKRPATLSKSIMTTILKDSLGFEGLVFSDGMNMKGITNYFDEGTAAVEALKAGVDVIEFVLNPELVTNSVLKAIGNNELDVSQIEEKCRKVLENKYWLKSNKAVPENRELLQQLLQKKYELTARTLYQQTLTVIENQQQILPLQRLDTLRIASIAVGRDQQSVFQDRLNSYMPIDHYQVNSREQLDEVLTRLKNYNLIITGVYGTSLRSGNNYGVTDLHKIAVKSVAKKWPSVLVFFSNPYSLSNYETVNEAAGIVVTYGEDDIVEDLSAQLIFGGIGSSGVLPVSINDRYQAGTGIEVKPMSRFKYTIPEEVGFDSHFLTNRIDSMVLYGLKEKIFPGCQVLLAKEGKVFFHKSYGFYTYDSINHLNNECIYDWASLTKITGPLPLIMKLYENGAINLDDPFSEYWKGFDKTDKKELTWREILAHQAGLKPWLPFYVHTIKSNSNYRRRFLRDRPSNNFPYRVSEHLYVQKKYKGKMIEEIENLELGQRGKYRYSGLAFYLFPDLIAQMYGAEYESLLKSKFLLPLGAYSVNYNPYRFYKIADFVPTEQDDFFRKELLQGFVHDEGAALFGGVSGNAGLFGTTNDLAKIMQLYLNGGNYGDVQFLKQETIREFTSVQFPEDENRRGLGFDKPYLENYKKKLDDAYPATAVSAESFGHSGYTGTFAWADPENQLLFIFMSNRVYPTRENTKLFDLNFRPELQQLIYECEGSFKEMSY